MSGSPAQIVDQLGPYAELGITRVYLRAPAQIERLAENFELFAGEVLPQLAGMYSASFRRPPARFLTHDLTK
ncbi:MAG: hypothetical protein WA317_05205 [Mycobacterium sp.]|uniref:hypothetical protein n=1 Tax=Mycobacterium sp. TaxID=1785 RepID=UPI003CC51983